MRAERFFLLLDGYIRVIRTTPTGDRIIALHTAPGQLLGIAPAIGRDTYPDTAMSASESLALSWPVRLWSDFTTKYEGFATETYRTMGQRLGEMQARVTELGRRRWSSGRSRRTCAVAHGARRTAHGRSCSR